MPRALRKLLLIAQQLSWPTQSFSCHRPSRLQGNNYNMELYLLPSWENLNYREIIFSCIFSFGFDTPPIDMVRGKEPT